MDILLIQASSVPSERVFSSGKETMTARRRHISPHLMEALQILKFSINKGRSLKEARMAPFGEAEAYGRTIDMVGEDSDEMDDVLNDSVKESEVESTNESN